MSLLLPVFCEKTECVLENIICFAKLGIFTLELCNTQFCFVIGHLILLSFGSGISLCTPV